MAFIPKNPISAPKSGTIPPIPEKGTRGIFPMADGWYDIDDEGTVSKLGSGSGGGDVDLSGKEDKSNKIDWINLDNPDEYQDGLKYPNALAVVGAILKNNYDIVDPIGETANEALTEALAAGDAAESALEEIERQKGIIITGHGMPADATVEKLGQLYYDEDSSPPDVYVCAKIDDESFGWFPVDVMGRDAYGLAAATAFDVYGDEGSIAQNYQRNSDKVTTISSNSTDEQYPSAKAVFEFVGNMEIVLDNIIAEQKSIIAIQNALIGGGNV